MKKISLMVLAAIAIVGASCEKLENSVPPVPVTLPADVVNYSNYFLEMTADGIVYRWESQVNGVANFTDKQHVGGCDPFFDAYSYASNFSHPSDTNYVKAISLYTAKCVPDTSSYATDSVFLTQSYPIEVDYGDSINAFSIAFLDNDTVLWQTNLYPDNTDAQLSHSLTIDTILTSYDGLSAYEIIGTFSGWVYNMDGDSILLQNGSFYSKARAF